MQHSSRDKLKKLIAKNPKITAREAAEHLGVSRQRLYQILKTEGVILARPTTILSRPVEIAKEKLSKHEGLPPYVVGEMNELLVAIDLLKLGYDVYRSITGRGLCDLVAVHRVNGSATRIEVKTAYNVKGRVLSSKGAQNKFDVLARVFWDGEIQYDPPL